MSRCVSDCMRCSTGCTAVLIFSLPSRLEALRKPFALGRSGARQTRHSRKVWATMQQLTSAKVKTAGLSCLHSTRLVPEPDYAAPFGQQLLTAVTTAFDQGYDRIIVIGNDCPDLRVGDLQAAANALGQGILPVGYDRRGGIFLLGLDRRFLKQTANQSFADLPWQTSQLGAALTNWLSNYVGNVASLASVRSDWNEQIDLRSGAWLSGAFAGLARRVWALVSLQKSLRFSFSFSFSSVTDQRTVPVRAPPANRLAIALSALNS